MKTLKKSIYRLFDDKKDWFDYIILFMVLTNVSFMILETVESLKAEYHLLFDAAEVFAIGFFTIEYILRVFTITENPKYRHPIKGRIKYMLSFMGIVDLFSFAFFYLKFVGLTWTSLQVFQALRLIKTLRYLESFNTIIHVLQEKKKVILSGMAIVMFILVISSVIMFHIEHEAQPEKFTSIPETMYWGVITMTSVGYGDMSPITPVGKFMGAIIAMLGICAFAIPVGAIASGFMDIDSQKREENQKMTKRQHELSIQEELVS